MTSATIAEIDFCELTDTTKLTETIRCGFGSDGLGILLVRNVPGLLDARQNALKSIQKFAVLPDDIKSKYEHADSFYSFGWSQGREKMKKDTPDTMKGSYYFNPEYDVPYGQEMAIANPLFCHPNIWPDCDVPEFRTTTMCLSSIIVGVARNILKGCDAIMCATYPSHQQDKFSIDIGDSKVNKGRLLHYFPITNVNANADLWCGAHNDHGFLTGLVSGMYFNENGSEYRGNSDPVAGLYIKSRSGISTKVSIPSDAIAFQIGESACILSGGLFQPTPHSVVAPVTPEFTGISRETMAVFFGPKWNYVMDCPPEADPRNIFSASTREFLPENIPVLESRWTPGISYQKFSENTFQSYYQ